MIAIATVIIEIVGTNVKATTLTSGSAIAAPLHIGPELLISQGVVISHRTSATVGTLPKVSGMMNRTQSHTAMHLPSAVMAKTTRLGLKRLLTNCNLAMMQQPNTRWTMRSPRCLMKTQKLSGGESVERRY